MKKNKSKQSKQKGFTLLETLVAIFILTLAITGPVYIASIAFRNTIDGRDNISAQYLAEEVVEVVRNMRDTYAIKHENASADWLTATGILEDSTYVDCLNNIGSIVNKCEMVKNPSSKEYLFKSCTSGLCSNISFNPSGEVVYGDSVTTSGLSKFTREFYFEKETVDLLSNTTGIKVVVNIKWNDKGREKIYTLTERLYNTNIRQYLTDPE